MKYTTELHPAQAEILRALLFKTDAGFSELNLTKLTTDHFTFHINSLVKAGLVEKTVKKYRLSQKGKEFANRMDTDTKEIERQAKLGVLVVAVQEGKMLLQQRLKHPYYGFWGYIGGKIRWGETVLETAARELKEETGLEAAFQINGVQHKMDYRTDSQLLEDKFFYVVKATKIKGDLMINFEGGKNAWMTTKAISQLNKQVKIFGGVMEIAQQIKKDDLFFWEQKFEYTPDEY
jgi:ADP-ribose pyrophosphatase YjhB (NUDIX family)